MQTGFIALGSYEPENVVTNEEVASTLGVDAQWIYDKTGITTRHWAPPEMPTSEMAYRAVLDLVGRHPTALDGITHIILATSTPDQPMPATAVALQARFGQLSGVPAMDVNAVCAGFLYAMYTARAFVAIEGPGARVLVVGADKYSAIINRFDRRTAPIFGDGAGAVVVGEVEAPYGIHSFKLQADGELQDLVRIVAGGTRRPLDLQAVADREHLFAMDGRGVAHYMLEELPKLMDATLDAAGVTLDDIDICVPHQANPKLLGTLADQIGLPRERLVVIGGELGNTGAASIPMALARAREHDRLHSGQLALLLGVGGGMTLGGTVKRIGEMLPAAVGGHA